ncbi:autotransporter outer membrane beta-barrel domain-containing protein [Arsenophonus endosymbiont of Bemisia tabaci Asia II 3]|nr:autotransporter outer membrane beta-barrel domain-containing protein [Arsenophonus endosymbiont of Bemisia tabaci Asia II 3]
MVDLTNTTSAISKLASDTVSVMAFQRQTLIRLQQGCISTDGYWCWSVNANTSNAITKDIGPEINLGYGMAEALSIGGVIEHVLSRSFPDSHEMNGNNIGLGFYAQWHIPFSVGESYLRPAVSFSQYNLGTKRSKLSKTEEGKGNSKMNGFGLSIEGGQNFILSNKILLGWHAGVRYSQLSRNRYKENNVHYPIEYKKINYDNTSGYVGADVSVPISSPLSWVSGIEIEHTLKESELAYNAQLDKIKNSSNKAPLSHTRGIVKTGFVYKLDKNFSFSVLTSLSQTTVGDKKWNTVLSLSGQF